MADFYSRGFDSGFWVTDGRFANLRADGTTTLNGRVNWGGNLILMPPPSGSDDAAGITSVIAGLSTPSSLIFGPGTYLLGSQVVFPAGISPLGAGGTQDYSEVVFKCTAASAGLAIGDTSATGIKVPLSGGFQVNANSVATNPLMFGKVTGSTFLPISVVNAASGGAAFLVQKSQNNTFITPNLANNAGDGFVLDLGCGGNLFLNAESSNSGGWACRFTQSGASADVYSIPQQNHFVTPRFERNPNILLHEAGTNNQVSHAVLGFGTAVAPHTLIQMTVLVSPSNHFILRDPIITGTVGQTTGLDIAANCNIHLAGQVVGSNMLNFGTIAVGAKVQLDYLPAFSQVTNTWVGAGAQDTVVQHRLAAALALSRGLGAWGHTIPTSQPATPVTLGDVIALLQSYGLSA